MESAKEYITTLIPVTNEHIIILETERLMFPNKWYHIVVGIIASLGWMFYIATLVQNR